jgi:hypothetical protein
VDHVTTECYFGNELEEVVLKEWFERVGIGIDNRKDY